MTPAHAVLHVALCTAIGTTAALLLHHGRHRPGHRHTAHRNHPHHNRRSTDRMTMHPLPIGTRVRHVNQRWATRISTAEVHDIRGPWPDGSYEYLVQTGEDFSRRPGPDNPQIRWTWWSSAATRPVTEEPTR